MIFKPFLRLAPQFHHACIRRRSSVSTIKMLTDKIVWIDLEMTGLNVERDTILEIACAITDYTLLDIVKGPNIVIKTSEEQLQSMNPWCINQHGKTGLTDLCKNSTVTLQEAEDTVLDFVKSHVIEGAAALGGNSVYMDRIFLMKYMPKLNSYLHYRIIDVTSIREVIKRWCPLAGRNAPEKGHTHRALDDVIDSINELKHYENFVIKNS